MLFHVSRQIGQQLQNSTSMLKEQRGSLGRAGDEELLLLAVDAAVSHCNGNRGHGHLLAQREVGGNSLSYSAAQAFHVPTQERTRLWLCRRQLPEPQQPPHGHPRMRCPSTDHHWCCSCASSSTAFPGSLNQTGLGKNIKTALSVRNHRNKYLVFCNSGVFNTD